MRGTGTRGPRAASALAIVLVAIALAMGCTGTEPTAGLGLRPLPIVRAILMVRPDHGVQVITVEESRLGPPPELPDSAFGPVPDATVRGALPVCDARVVLYDELGDSAVAIRPAGEPPGPCTATSVRPGEYVVGSRSAQECFAPNDRWCLSIVAGRRYRLRVETRLGVVTGETHVPAEDPVVRMGSTDASGVIVLPAIELFSVRVQAPGAFYRVFYTGDAWLDLASSTPPRLSVDGHVIRADGTDAASGFGRLTMTTVDPCRGTLPLAQRPPRALQVMVIDSNYRSFLLDDADRDILDDRRAPTGVRGGWGVFGAARLIGEWRFHTTIQEVDGLGRRIEPVGRWAPQPEAGVDLPMLCLFEHSESIGARFFRGITEPTGRLPALEVFGQLRRGASAAPDTVSLELPSFGTGTSAPTRWRLDGLRTADTLQMTVRIPAELAGRVFRWVRVPIE